MRPTRVTAALVVVGLTAVLPDRGSRGLRRIGPRRPVQPIRFAEAGIAADRLERRRGVCVIDTYTTSKASYREIAYHLLGL